MGNECSASTRAEKSLNDVLPWFYNREGYSASQVRKRFIEMALMVLSENGKHKIHDLDVQLYYVRKPVSEVQYKAVLTLKHGRTVLRTYTPIHGGDTYHKAWTQLSIEIEQQAELLLQGQPMTRGTVVTAKCNMEPTTTAKDNKDGKPPPYDLGLDPA